MMKPSAKSKTVNTGGHRSEDPMFAPNARAAARRETPRLENQAPQNSEVATTDRRVTGSPQVNSQGSVLPEGQWQANAAQIELETNHELKRLTALLDLDYKQQDQVFSALARKSPYWLPGMTADINTRSGTPTSTPATSGSSSKPSSNDQASNKDSGLPNVVTPLPAVVLDPALQLTDNGDLPEVVDTLDSDQEQQIVQEEMDRQAWWEEVLPQLLPPTLGGDYEVAAGALPTDGEPPPDTKEFEGGDVLLEE